MNTQEFKHKGSKWFCGTLVWDTHFGWPHYCFVIQNTLAKLTYFKTVVQWFVTSEKCYISNNTNLNRYADTFNECVNPGICGFLLDTTSFTEIVWSCFQKSACYVHICSCDSMGRDSSAGIATRYGLDGPGIEFRWGRDFPHLSRPALGPTQPPVQWVPGLSRG